MRRVAVLVLVSMLVGLVGEDVASAVDTQSPSRVTPKFVRRSKINKDGTLPILLQWTYGGDMSVVGYFVLQESVNEGPFEPILQAPVLSFIMNLDPNGDTYAYRVAAKLSCDGCGKSEFSDWSIPRGFGLIPFQEASPEITYGGTWTHDSLEGAWGGGVTYTLERHDSAFFDFFGAAAAYVGTRGAGYSKFLATADGVDRGWRTLGQRTDLVTRRIISRYNWGSNGIHQLGIEDNRYNARIDVDGFVVIRYV